MNLSVAVAYSTIGPIAVAEINNPPVNAVNRGVRVGLAEALARAGLDTAIKALLIVSAGRVFMAGADINELGQSMSEPTLQALEAAIESASLPVIVGIQGSALGGGLELAMACHYRVAAADAKLGLPEITLGLIPGAGGTQRLPRLIGAPRALAMMLSGRPITAADGLAWGLLDEVASADLRDCAIMFCERLIADNGKPRRTKELSVSEQLRSGSVEKLLLSHARTLKGLTVPSMIVEAVRAASLPIEEGMAIEARLATKSLGLRESRALRYLFFAERLSGKVTGGPPDISLPRIAHAAIIGAGTMGSGIALAFADAGLAVTLIDSAEAGLRRGVDAIHSTLTASVKRGRIDQATAARRANQIRTSMSLADAGAADIVIEAVFEDMDIKKQLLSALDQIVPVERLIASNTSTLSVTELARATKHPGRIAGLHFFSPANVMKLLEIVRGVDTTPHTLDIALQVSRLLKKVGVVANDAFGFIGNRMMLDGYFREAEYLLLEGASPSDIDSALQGFGFAMGPQRVSDLGGTDVGTKARAQLYRRESGPNPYFVIADRLTAMGRLGQKSGAGFYRYEAGGREALADPEVTDIIEELARASGIDRRTIGASEIVERCVLSLILVGAKVLEEGTAARASDIDVVWTSGYGFPRYLGGPLFYADTLGLKHVADRIRHYHKQYGHYWQPVALIEQLADSNSTFLAWDAVRQ